MKRKREEKKEKIKIRSGEMGKQIAILIGG